MRHRIQIQDFTVTKSPLNQRLKDPTPVVVGEFWADVRSLTGRELVNASQVKATVSHKVTMRYHVAIKPTYKIAFDGRIFQVLWTDDVGERRRELQIYCTEEVRS